MRRLGYLSIWSPFTPFSSYSLDLSHNDARVLLKTIICLCLVEGRRDITNVIYNGIATSLPAEWLLRAPLQGSLQFCLTSPPKPDIAYCERVASFVLNWATDVVQRASERIKAQFPAVIDVVKQRRRRMPSMTPSISSSTGSTSRRTPSLPPMLHARFEQDCET